MIFLFLLLVSFSLICLSDNFFILQTSANFSFKCDIRNPIHLFGFKLQPLLLSIYLWLYSPCGPWLLFQFLGLYTVR
jgi:hypothetical protein